MDDFETASSPEAKPPADAVIGSFFRTGDETRSSIRVLPADVSARIAAGEVVERPASVVKELVENALDAGACNLRIDIQGGGLALIRVGDDGSGISPAELRLACRRHATSKLGSGDLSQIRTLGFRGEALPSIAAVAVLEMLSAVDDSGIGRRVTVRDGHIIAERPAPRRRGTTVTIRHLFHNVPARRAAAARVQQEIAQIGQTVRRLALAAPDVRFTLFVADRLVLQTTGAGDLTTTLIEVYGEALTGSLISVGPVEVAGARIHGVVGGPEVTRPSRNQVNLIVNGRWVQPRGLVSQLEAAYRPVLPRGRHPLLALIIETAPDQVDINIHPAKTEVRLLAERAIATALGELARDALGRRPTSLMLEPDMGLAALNLPGLTGPAIAEDQAVYDDEPIVTPGLPPLRLLGQLQGRLLLLEGPAALYLVDQHRAHERIIYEQLTASERGGESEPVVLPEPLLLELRPAQVARFGRRLDDLAALGFDCEVFGGRHFLVRALPALPGVVSSEASDPLEHLGSQDGIAATLLALADDEAAEGETWRERLLVQLACRTAVRRGRTLDRPIMRALVEGLGSTSAPAVCPHGSPLLMRVSDDLFERQFGWR